MKQDEKDFLILIYQENCKAREEKRYPLIFPRTIISQDNFKLYYEDAWELLEKWCNNGLYEYGITLDLGWLTEKGKQKAIELIKEREESKL